MKREILFRGKRVDNGGWVEGGFGQDSDGTYILVPRKNKLFWVVPVDPDSVCQFTGLTDKNGVKIFEGDVVKDWAGTRAIKFEIYDNYQGYDLEPDDIDCEVIGNIHDNPDLI